MADSLVGWLITDSMDMSFSKLQETVKDRETWLENPHGQRSLADYSPWGLKESDMTEQLSTTS